MMRTTTLFIGAALVCLTGCTSGGDPIDPQPNSGVEAPEGYPAGPYGTGKGSIIQDYAFPGYGRPAAGLGDERRDDLHLSDFYNPTGDELYDAESIYPEGEPKPRALVITVSGSWCPPCKDEAARILPGEYAHFHPEGMELLVVLADGTRPGVTAVIDDLHAWIGSFAVNYPAGLDPKRRLGALFQADALPANFIIDTRTMTIVELVTGVPRASFWLTVEDVLYDEGAP